MYNVSKFAGSVTVKAYPGETVVWIPTLPSGSMTMASVVASQNSATLCVWMLVSFWYTMRAVVVPALLIVNEFVVWTFVAVIIRFPVTARFETERYSIAAFPGTYRFEKVASGPVKFMTEETLRSCVLMYGIVNVSKKNVAFAAFAVMDPLTLNVSVTVTFVRFDVP